MEKDITHNRKRTFLTYLAIWFACALIGVATTGLALNWLKYYYLYARGVETQGWVVAKEPENHAFIRYSYIVGGRTYTDLGSAGRGNPSFRDLKAGDSLIVFYDPVNPNESCLGYPSLHFQERNLGIIFVLIFFPLFSLIAVYSKGYLKRKGAV